MSFLRSRAGRAIPSVITYVLVIFALALGLLWLIPANPGYYMIFPGQAQQVAPMISVPGHHFSHVPGGVYDTYVNEFRATRLLYVLFGLVRSDVTVQPASEVSSGCPDSQYQQQMMGMMAYSKIQAEAAALQSLGYKVQTDGRGPQITDVACGVPAASVLQAGDQVIAVDGVPVRSIKYTPSPNDGGPGIAAVKAMIIKHKPGDIVRLTIVRNGITKQVAVRTVHGLNGTIVNAGGKAMIGISMVMPLKFPFRVNIDSGSVGGPSAGLAFTLGIIQQLSGKDLTGGKRVAVTGTINYVQARLKNGTYVDQSLVGPIGGARQKALAAQAAGAKYFIVPYDNYAEALSAHAHLQVIPVSTLNQALNVLKMLRTAGHSGSSSSS